VKRTSVNISRAFDRFSREISDLTKVQTIQNTGFGQASDTDASANPDPQFGWPGSQTATGGVS
jgi:hypothetical protein